MVRSHHLPFWLLLLLRDVAVGVPVMWVCASLGCKTRVGGLSLQLSNLGYNSNIIIIIIIYICLLQLGCHPVAVVILHVNKTLNWLLLMWVLC